MTKEHERNITTAGALDSMDTLIREISWGYRPSIILLTANRLRIFDRLEGGPAAPAELARSLKLDERALTILLDALAALGLLSKGRDGYLVPPEAREILVKDGKRYRGNILDHRYNLLRRWTDLLNVLEQGGPARIMRSKRTPEEWREFILGMVDVAGSSVDAFLDALDLEGRSKLLDLGGGPATYSIALCERHAELRAVIFDLPETTAIADEEIERRGLTGRIGTVSGDYLADPLGEGYDAVLVSNIIHSLSFDETVRLLGKARSAMIPGGLIAVRDFYIEEDRTAPLESVLFAVNMLVSTEGGDCYTPAEVEKAMRLAGFAGFEQIRITPVSSLYIGTNPGDSDGGARSTEGGTAE